MSDTVMILQDECILVVEGRAGKNPKISRIERIPTDSFADQIEQWRTALTGYQEKHHPSQVRLVLPMGYSTTRITKLPYASGKQLAGMAAHMIQENGGNELTDYSVLSSDKKRGVTLCCGSAAEDIIQKISTLFEELSLPVSGMTVPMEGCLRLMDHIKAVKDETAIYLLFEENNVNSILYKNGSYHYSSRSRIFSEQGTLDFGTEIVRIVSGIRQFYSTQRDADPITKVYYVGCSDEDFEVCVEGIENMDLSIEAMEVKLPFDGTTAPADYMTCYGAMITDKKDINLYELWQATQQKEQEISFELKREIIYPLLTFAICLVLTAGVSIWNLSASAQLDAINDWIYDDGNQSSYRAANERRSYSAKLGQAVNQVDQMTENLSTYPDLTNDMIARIENVSGRDMDVQVQSVDMSTGILTFNALSRQVIDIPGYINLLDGTGLFDTVNYTGYSYGDGEYSLMLSCVLKAADAGEDE